MREKTVPQVRRMQRLNSLNLIFQTCYYLRVRGRKRYRQRLDSCVNVQSKSFECPTHPLRSFRANRAACMLDIVKFGYNLSMLENKQGNLFHRITASNQFITALESSCSFTFGFSARRILSVTNADKMIANIIVTALYTSKNKCTFDLKYNHKCRKKVFSYHPVNTDRLMWKAVMSVFY